MSSIRRNTEATARAMLIQTQMMYDAMTPEQQRKVDDAIVARRVTEATQRREEADTMILRGSLFLGGLVAIAFIMGGIGAMLHMLH